MREKGNKVDIRLSNDDNDNLTQLMKKSGWSRSETMRFCLNFTHMILSTMPATTIDAVLSEQINPTDD